MFESSFVLGPTQRIVPPFPACIQRYPLCPGALVQTTEFALWPSQADQGDRGAPRISRGSGSQAQGGRRVESASQSCLVEMPVQPPLDTDQVQPDAGPRVSPPSHCPSRHHKLGAVAMPWTEICPVPISPTTSLSPGAA